MLIIIDILNIFDGNFDNQILYQIFKSFIR